MIYQVRNFRGQRLLERETPEEVLEYIRTRATGYAEVWTLEASPGPLVCVETARDFQRRYRTGSTKNVEGVRL